MNNKIKEFAEQAGGFVDLNQHVSAGNGCMVYTYNGLENFAKVIIKDYTSKLILANMSNPEYARAMDEYYEQKWAHRFD